MVTRWLGMLFVFALIACGAPDEPAASTATAVPQDEANLVDYSADAKALRQALDQLYPSLDRFGQAADVTAALDRLDALATENPQSMAFYRAVTEVAVSTRDEHVIPFPAEDYRASRRAGKMMLPYTVQWINDEPYLSAVADPELQTMVGAKILAFDGVEAGQIFAKLVATIPSDGLSGTFAKRRLQDFTPTQNENYFDLNYPIWFGERDAYTLTLAIGEGSTRDISAEALDWSAFSAFYRARLPRENPVHFRWLSETTAYLGILSFHDWYYAEHDVDAAQEFEDIFSALRDRPGASLILDLRRNEGGGDISSLLLDYLLNRPFTEYDDVITSFVGQPDAARFCDNSEDVRFDPSWAEQRPDGLYQLRDEFLGLITGGLERTPAAGAFTGEIIVLISGGTGSAAAKVSAVLRREGRARFVGEEAGGAAAGATAFGNCALVLPNSGIRLDLPLIRFERDTDIPYGRGVLPDVEIDAGRVPPAVAEDHVLTAAVELLNTND